MAHLLHVRGEGEGLCTEEVDPQVPVGFDPRYPSQTTREDGCLGDRVGVEVVELHPVVMGEQPHEAACGHPEPSLMEGGEADHVARRRGRLLLVSRCKPLRVHFVGMGAEQSSIHQGLQIFVRDRGNGPCVAGGGGRTLSFSAIATEEEDEGGRTGAFFFLRLKKAKAARAERQRRGKKREDPSRANI